MRRVIECTATALPHLYTAGKAYMVLESFMTSAGECHAITNDTGCADIVCPASDTTNQWRLSSEKKSKTRRPVASGVHQVLLCACG